MSALTGRRVLSTQFPMARMVWTADSPLTKQFKPASDLIDRLRTRDWAGVATKPMFYSETYFDLSGYTMEDLTLIPINTRVQDPGVYMFTGADQVFATYDILSQERLTEDDLKLISSRNNGLQQAGPGQAFGPLDKDQIVYGLYRFFTNNTTQTGLGQLMLNTRTTRFGMGQPTAVEKLWAYRIVVMFGDPAVDTVVTIPASTFVLAADIVKEDDLPYMMRLKRSYELATGN